MKKMYVVNEEGGEYDDSYSTAIFVTENLDIARNFVNKANDLFPILYKYYKKEYDKIINSLKQFDNLPYGDKILSGDEYNLCIMKEQLFYDRKQKYYNCSFSFNEIELR